MNLVLFEAGHTSKLMVIAQFAIIVAGLLLTFRKKYLLGGILFALGMALDIFANHVQMTFYLGLCLAIYVIIEIIQGIKKGEILHLAKVGRNFKFWINYRNSYFCFLTLDFL